jgi:6-phosphogluconolactonase
VNLNTYPDCDLMYMDLASRLAGELRTALTSEETAAFAVPGGTTPGPVFDELCAADLDWARVCVLLTDERRVPPDHARSNERLVRERLLTSRAAVATFVRLVPEEEDMSKVIAAIEPLLPIDVMLLGMGADMHTASLFPGSPDLEAALDRHAPPVMLVEATGDLEPRITLTGPVLSGAISTHVVIRGEDKRAALEKARHLKPAEAPIATVLGNAEIHWAP